MIVLWPFVACFDRVYVPNVRYHRVPNIWKLAFYMTLYEAASQGFSGVLWCILARVIPKLIGNN